MIAWPGVVNYLVATLPTLPGWASVDVFDGEPVTGDDPTDWASVGYIADDHGGTFTRNNNPDGSGVDEAGDVRCELECQSGDGDLVDVRVRAFTLASALDRKLNNDRTLAGALSQNGTVTLTVGVLSIKASTGVAQSLSLVVAYTTTDYPF
jgi:hypothetical protein